MATAKEREIKRQLLEDPEYRAAWDAYKDAVARDMKALSDGATPDYLEGVRAGEAVFALLDRRPDLVALVELAETPDH